MPTLTQLHRQLRRDRGPLGRPTTDDRLAVMEEAVAEATGRTVAELHQAARDKAEERVWPLAKG